MLKKTSESSYLELSLPSASSSSSKPSDKSLWSVNKNKVSIGSICIRPARSQRLKRHKTLLTFDLVGLTFLLLHLLPYQPFVQPLLLFGFGLLKLLGEGMLASSKHVIAHEIFFFLGEVWG